MTRSLTDSTLGRTAVDRHFTGQKRSLCHVLTSVRYTHPREPVKVGEKKTARLRVTGGNDNLDVDLERINTLYGNSLIGYIGIAAALGCFGFISWQLAEPRYSIFWTSSVAVAYLPQVLLTTLFKRRSRQHEIKPETARSWERRFLYTSIAPFICFSTAVLIPYGDNAYDAVLYYAIIVMTLMSGAILTYSTSLPIILLYLNLIMLPLVLRCLLIQDTLFYALGLALALVYGLFSLLIPRFHKLLLENITLKLENQVQSLTDPLTKLGNRRRLQLRIEDLTPLSRRSGQPFSIILIDIDHFKEFNDRLGHSAGDALLITVADILTRSSRDQDLVVRYGGEEFLIVLPASDLKDAIVLVERIQKGIKENTEVTVSAGLAMHSEHLDFGQLVHKADLSLYSAKKAGRDRYVLADTA